MVFNILPERICRQSNKRAVKILKKYELLISNLNWLLIFWLKSSTIFFLNFPTDSNFFKYLMANTWIKEIYFQDYFLFHDFGTAYFFSDVQDVPIFPLYFCTPFVLSLGEFVSFVEQNATARLCMRICFRGISITLINHYLSNESPSGIHIPPQSLTLHYIEEKSWPNTLRAQRAIDLELKSQHVLQVV